MWLAQLGLYRMEQKIYYIHANIMRSCICELGEWESEVHLNTNAQRGENAGFGTLFSFSGLRSTSFRGMKRQKAFLRHPTSLNGRTNIQKLIGKGILMSVLKFVKTFWSATVLQRMIQGLRYFSRYVSYMQWNFINRQPFSYLYLTGLGSGD